MSNTNVVKVDGFEFQYRDDDYVNLTNMCKQAGKKINHYLSSAETKAFLKELAYRLNCTIDDLIISRKGGVPTQQGTWGHLIIAIHLAQWLSPTLYIDIALNLSHILNEDLLQEFTSNSSIKDVSGFIYLIHIKEANIYKIGYSKNVIKRLSTLQTANALELVIVERFFSLNARKLESRVHQHYQSNHVRGEWFQLSPEQVQQFIYTVNQLDRDEEEQEESSFLLKESLVAGII